jgi:predicted MPP superfamily phosphohydrolase
MIQRTEHRVAVPNLPEALCGLRIVHLTDLHRCHLTPDRLLRHAIALANAACPDLVVLTGDFVTRDPADIEPCASLLAPLRARLGVYAVLGNHDYYTDARAVERMLTRLGIQVLVNRSACVEGLYLVGLDDDRHGQPDIARAFSDVPPGAPILAMAHNPAFAERLAERDCIVLSGHTHGGQVHLPVLTAREVRRIGAKHYRAGWFQVGKARLYVNRGLGHVGIPLRLFCRPEVAVFTLEPAASPAAQSDAFAASALTL